jgi:hypothetical protein
MPLIGSFAGASARAYGLGAGVLIGDFESIAATTVGSGGVADVTFSSIPQIYTHLQIRCILKFAVGGDTILTQFNSDTGSNYTFRRLSGNGSSASAGTSRPRTSLIIASDVPSATSTFGVTVTDILDYTNTNKYKTVRALCGHETNSAGAAELKSGVWVNTNAITSIKIFGGSGNISEYSSIALYGIKG